MLEKAFSSSLLIETIDFILSIICVIYLV
jgi:hypothetical protein